MDGSALNVVDSGQIELGMRNVLLRREEIDRDRAQTLLDEMIELDAWTHPILVERDTDVILDGHHRYWCAEQLGLDLVPVFKVSYDDPALVLSSWRSDMTLVPGKVVAAARSGRLFPKKTSRHVYAPGIITCSIPLKQLLRGYIA